MENPASPQGRIGKHRTLIIVIIAVVAVAVAAIGVFVYQFETTVDVTGVVWDINQPGLGTVPSLPQSGFTVSTGAEQTVQWNWSYGVCGVPCSPSTVENPAVQTSGFALVSSDCPLTIQPHSYGMIYLTVKVPNSEFSGQLTVYVSITS